MRYLIAVNSSISLYLPPSSGDGLGCSCPHPQLSPFVLVPLDGVASQGQPQDEEDKDGPPRRARAVEVNDGERTIVQRFLLETVGFDYFCRLAE